VLAHELVPSVAVVDFRSNLRVVDERPGDFVRRVLRPGLLKYFPEPLTLEVAALMEQPLDFGGALGQGREQRGVLFLCFPLSPSF